MLSWHKMDISPNIKTIPQTVWEELGNRHIHTQCYWNDFCQTEINAKLSSLAEYQANRNSTNTASWCIPYTFF